MISPKHALSAWTLAAALTLASLVACGDDASSADTASQNAGTSTNTTETSTNNTTTTSTTSQNTATTSAQTTTGTTNIFDGIGDGDVPDLEVCARATSRTECYNAGCNVWDANAEVWIYSDTEGTCAQKLARTNVCWVSRGTASASPTISGYYRETSEGAYEVVWLRDYSHDVVGWTWCGGNTQVDACTCGGPG